LLILYVTKIAAKKALSLFINDYGYEQTTACVENRFIFTKTIFSEEVRLKPHFQKTICGLYIAILMIRIVSILQ